MEILQDERRVTFPEDVWVAIEKAAKTERAKMKNPLIKETITGKSLVQHIVKNWVQKYGYWEPKEKVRRGKK